MYHIKKLVICFSIGIVSILMLSFSVYGATSNYFSVKNVGEIKYEKNEISVRIRGIMFDFNNQVYSETLQTLTTKNGGNTVSFISMKDWNLPPFIFTPTNCYLVYRIEIHNINNFPIEGLFLAENNLPHCRTSVYHEQLPLNDGKFIVLPKTSSCIDYRLDMSGINNYVYFDSPTFSTEFTRHYF